MKFQMLLHTALQSLWNNKRRTLLTMLGIVIGIASVIAIISIGKGFQRETVSNLTSSESDKMSVVAYFIPDNMNMQSSRMEPFSPRNIADIKRIEGVDGVSTEQSSQSYYTVTVQAGNDTFSTAADLLDGTESPTELVAGNHIDRADNAGKKKVVIIRQDIAEKMYGSAENAIGKGIDINGVKFYIKGVAPPLKPQIISFSLGFEKEIMLPKSAYQFYFEKNKKEAVTELTVFVKTDYSVKAVSDDLIEYLDKNGNNRQIGTYGVLDMSQMMQAIGNVINSLTYFISAIAGISLLIAGVGVMNMMYISVSERTKEIGIRRAMGATKESIQMQFLLEGILVTFSGGIIGYLFGILVATLISKLLPFGIYIDIPTILMTVVVSLLIGVVFSVMPAKAAAKKDVIDILR